MTADSDRRTPLVIGVTGHRDLVDSETAALTTRIEGLFDELRRRFPNTPLAVMSALAEGADRLAATAALGAGVPVVSVLPMPADDYRADFETPESNAAFDRLCTASTVVELPVTDAEAVRRPGAARDRAYANAGMFISAHCHILLALWDGVRSEQTGGTSQIVYFQHYDRLPGLAESVPRSSLFLTDDESDLVYHVTCSRAREPAAEDAMAPLETHWYTADPDRPRTAAMPARYERVFARMDEYNRDARKLAVAIEAAGSWEAEPPPTASEHAARSIRDYFDVADQLANFFQRRVDRTLAAVHTLAVLAGLAFIVYSEVTRLDPFLYAFLGFIVFGIAVVGIAQRREWHRKYLDYRVLAEGLRVQFYWTIAGVRGHGHTKFAYDNFLRQRDMELGWIRNVMRVAGTLSDAEPPSLDRRGLEFAIERWIGAPGEGGQLDYYRRKVVSRRRINGLIQSLTRACLWGGIGAAVLLAVASDGLEPSWGEALIVLMGVLPLIAGVAEVYSQRKADRELVKQYQFMANVFGNARRRLAEAANDAERREVLLGLGDAALSEHAEWILVHRERQPEPAGL